METITNLPSYERNFALMNDAWLGESDESSRKLQQILKESGKCLLFFFTLRVDISARPSGSTESSMEVGDLTSGARRHDFGRGCRARPQTRELQTYDSGTTYPDQRQSQLGSPPEEQADFANAEAGIVRDVEAALSEYAKRHTSLLASLTVDRLKWARTPYYARPEIEICGDVPIQVSKPSGGCPIERDAGT